MLAVVDKWPWPAVDGGRQRLAALLGAVGSLGRVDLVVWDRTGGRSRPDQLDQLDRLDRLDQPDQPDQPDRVGRVAVVAAPARPRRWPRRPVHPARGPELPRTLAVRDRERLAAVVRRWTAEVAYDLIWVYDLHSYGAAEPALPPGVPVAVDLVDLVAELHERDVAADRSTPLRSAGQLRQRRRRAVDARRWRTLQDRAVARADLVTVCSTHDAEAVRARVPTASPVVVPNGYAGGAPPPERHDPPVLGLVGNHAYPPNSVAARRLARGVLPRVHDHGIEARALIVGRAPAAVRALAGGSVEVTGPVDEVGPCLARTDVVVVPLESGSGTRIKILEAFAHHLPVVATPVAAEGLDVRDGHEVLLGESDEQLAAACVRVLGDDELRSRLVAAGAALLEREHRWGHAADGLRRALADVARPAPVPPTALGHRSVSMVICTYQRAEALRANLAELLALDGVDEVVVVVDGSTDDTMAVLRRITDPRLRVVWTPNRGLPAARTTGAALARGEWVLFVDDDDRCPTDHVPHLLAVADTHTADIVSTPKLWGGRQRIEARVEAARRRPVERPRYGELSGFPAADVETIHLCSTALVRRSVLEVVAHDPGYRGNAYMEESDFYVRAARAGFRSVLTPQSWVSEAGRFPGGCRMAPLTYQAWSVRNEVRFLLRHAGWLRRSGTWPHPTRDVAGAQIARWVLPLRRRASRMTRVARTARGGGG